MMALDGKTIIKEEIPDKDVYDSSNNSRRTKGNGKDNCRTPDSPESARAVAPRSPMSPQIHHTSLAPPRPNRNASSSPVVNGATTTPPPATSAITPHHEQTRALSKIRKFLGSLVQFAQDTHPEVSDRIRALVLSLASGGINIEEFRIALQEATNYPLRPYVIPYLKSHIPLLQREIAGLARATNQTTLQYVTTNDTCAMELSHGPAEHGEIFLPLETPAAVNGNGVMYSSNKRRSSDTASDPHSGVQDWNDYMYPPAKRHSHSSLITSASGNLFSSQHPLFEFQPNAVNQGEGFGVLLDKSSHREERDSRSAESQRMSRMSGEEEWKNIHTMLNCISAMVDKTKRAITILQQRGVDPQPSYSDTAVAEIRRQTEEKVAEFKRNAEDAVNQVKRQAVIEIQRAVAAAESRAVEIMAQERLKMEKFFVDMSKHAVDGDVENKSPSLSAGHSVGEPSQPLANSSNPTTLSQQACWNCGRKANETCSGCNTARYCGAFCQHKDWEHHHQICGNVRTDVAGVIAPKPSSQAVRSQNARSPPTQSQQPAPVGAQPPQPNPVANGVSSAGGTK